MSLRVLAGELRGRTLEAMPDLGLVRPTAARRRAAVFDILRGQLPTFAGRALADLFAGTGAVAIEALSQGFDEVVLVEQEPRAVALIQRNLQNLELQSRARLLRLDATRLVAAERPLDVIFMDPPYGQGLADPALRSLLTAGWLAPDGVALLEVGKRDEVAVPAGLALAKTYPHGAGRLLRLART